VVLVAATLALFVTTTARTASPPQAAVTQEVTAVFTDWIAAFKRGDLDGMMSYLWKSDDFIVLTRTGEIVRGWTAFRTRMAGQPRGSTAEFKVLTVIPIAPASAMLMYTAAEPGEKDPLKITRGTMVWTRTNDGWRCLAFQFARPTQ